MGKVLFSYCTADRRGVLFSFADWKDGFPNRISVVTFVSAKVVWIFRDS